MLRLKNIVKNYDSGGTVVEALKNVSIDFRDSDFVAILGHSGCGKTTMLNIVGGLDKYTCGDLIINGRSTKDFGDRDWDAYRNHSIGFVFQSYNLIPHQTVLSNVELALTLSGVSKAERKRRAIEALDRVGLHDQIGKRPNQLSGGQMQRVAIARALVNDPEIILADEPTGALDTETSVQVMDILKSVSRDRLVIMVTHNPELAETYATRTIRMIDGKIIDDSRPLTAEEYAAGEAREAALIAARKAKKKKDKKPSMSFGTSFMLSLRNLFTKRGRTVLTSFAGSIGIIGIALILAVSQGMTAYINEVQESTLSTYPLTIQSQTVDMTALMESLMGGGEVSEHDKDAVYKDPIIGQLVNALSEVEASKNDLKAFREFIEAELADKDSELSAAVNGLAYTYDLEIPIYTQNVDGEIIKSDTGELVSEMLIDFMAQLAESDSPLGSMAPSGAGGGLSSEMMGSMMGLQMWEELLPGLDGSPVNPLILDQYDLVYGDWPSEKDEIILVLDRNNELDDLTLYALGLLEREEIDAIISAAASGKELPASDKKWSYEEICSMTFRTIMPYDCYKEIGDTGVFYNQLDTENDVLNPLRVLYEDAFELRVVGIIRPNEDADVAMLKGSIGYTHAFTEHVIEGAKNSPVVKAQLADPTVDVLTGLPFKSTTGSMTDAEKSESFGDYVTTLTQKGKAEAFFKIACLAAYDEKLEGASDQMIGFMLIDKDNNGDGGRGELIETIGTMIASGSGSEVDPAMITSYLEKLSLDELKELIRPSVEEQAKKQIDAGVEASLALMNEEARAAALDAAMENGTYTEADRAHYYDEVTKFSENSYEETLTAVGCVELDTPYTINLFASTFENRDVIIAAIDKYNESVPEAKKISNTDYLGIMMDSITIIINAITYVLIAFVAISLVVSSIMIGVITLISVQERTKEIGILRAIGASKRNVSSMFNAETIIVGAAAGLLGVLITYLFCIPINMILYHFTGIANLRAFLPVGAALILVLISIVLTMFAGLIPSKSAAKKDPVVALRTE